MYTQVTYAELVHKLLVGIGKPLGIELVQPSLSDLHSYENGKRLYNINGIDVEVFRWGSGWGREDPWNGMSLRAITGVMIERCLNGGLAAFFSWHRAHQLKNLSPQIGLKPRPSAAP